MYIVYCVYYNNYVYVFETGSKKNLYRFVEGDTLLHIIFGEQSQVVHSCPFRKKLTNYETYN